MKRPFAWIAVLVAVLLVGQELVRRAGSAGVDGRIEAQERRDPASSPQSGQSRPSSRNPRAGEWLEDSGVVTRLLSDDWQGSRHQRFILRRGLGDTLLIVHNIDLAPRVVALRVGDRVDFRGEFELNARGGVVHWTHHDPQGRQAGGWLRHQGRTYR